MRNNSNWGYIVIIVEHMYIEFPKVKQKLKQPRNESGSTDKYSVTCLKDTLLRERGRCCSRYLPMLEKLLFRSNRPIVKPPMPGAVTKEIST